MAVRPSFWEAMAWRGWLVRRFQRNLDVYRRPASKETQVRKDLSTPSWRGWAGTGNFKGYAEQDDDVIYMVWRFSLQVIWWGRSNDVRVLGELPGEYGI
jgi:hypothetical protein